MKTNIRIIAVMFLALTCLFGCSNTLSENDEIPYDTTPIPNEAELPIDHLMIDFPYYSTPEEVVDASTNVFTGKVVDVSFEIIDCQTGEVDRSASSESTHRLLYTVYTIEVDKNYKGGNEKTVMLSLEGGMVGWREEEQFGLLKEAGLETWPLAERTKKLVIGESYLFCTYRASHFDCVINLDHFAHYPNSQSARQIIRQCEKQ